MIHSIRFCLFSDGYFKNSLFNRREELVHADEPLLHGNALAAQQLDAGFARDAGKNRPGLLSRI